MNILKMSLDHLNDVARLCTQELVLDRDAGSIPGILMRRPCLGLVAAEDATTVGACIGSIAAEGDGVTEGFIDLLVVDRAGQRRGIGRQLLGAIERQLAERGCQQIELAGNGPYYAWPGIDIHYTAAVCLAEDLGYRRRGCEVNMDVDLRRVPLDTGPAEDELRCAGIECRRAGSADDGPLQD